MVSFFLSSSQSSPPFTVFLCQTWLPVPRVSPVFYGCHLSTAASSQGAVRFDFGDCAVALPESALLLKGAVCFDATAPFPFSERRVRFCFSFPDEIPRLRGFLDFPRGTCCLHIHMNQPLLWPSSTQMHRHGV